MSTKLGYPNTNIGGVYIHGFYTYRNNFKQIVEVSEKILKNFIDKKYKYSHVLDFIMRMTIVIY